MQDPNSETPGITMYVVDSYFHFFPTKAYLSNAKCRSEVVFTRRRKKMFFKLRAIYEENCSKQFSVTPDAATSREKSRRFVYNQPPAAPRLTALCRDAVTHSPMQWERVMLREPETSSGF